MSITVTAQEQTEAPTTHLSLESDVPHFPGRTPINLHVGQFYAGPPPFMGGGEPEPAGLFLEVTDTKGEITSNLNAVHMNRESVERLHAELGAWLDGKWGVDRPEVDQLGDAMKGLMDKIGALL